MPMAELDEALISLVVEESTDGIYNCEATFGNWGPAAGKLDFLYLDRGTFNFGNFFSVSTGEGTDNRTIFEGRITGIEAQYPKIASPQITILAEDRLQDLRMTRKTRTFEMQTDAQVIQQIAAEHGLVAEATVIGPVHTVLAQMNQSDLAFLRNRARAIDAEIWVEGEELKAETRSRRRHDVVTLNHGDNLREFSVLADLAHQRTSVTVSGWDPMVKLPIEFIATEAVMGIELAGNLGGGATLTSSFGTREERIVHQTPFSIDEARNLAQAQYRNNARRFVTGRGSAEGDGRIRVGTHLKMEKLGGMFSGTYFVTQVKHTFDQENGYITNFGVERAGISLL